MVYQERDKMEEANQPPVAQPGMSAANDSEERAQIDTKIRTEAKGHMRGTRRNFRRNELVPIGKMPPEFFMESDKIYPWIKVLRVCHYWREVGYSCASLWSVIDINSKKMTEICLKNSKQTPLTVLIPVIGMGPPGHLYRELPSLNEVLQHHVHRVRCIEASCTLLDSWRRLVPTFGRWLFNASAPILQTLALEFPQRGGTEPFRLPVTFISGGAPELRTLRLRGVKLPWASPLLSELTSLIMQNSPPSSSSSTPAQFFDALARMPALTQLEMDNLPAGLDKFKSQISLRMPQLKILKVTSSYKNCCNLLDRIMMPISARINLRMTVYDITTYDEVDSSLCFPLATSLDKAWLSNPLSSSLDPSVDKNATGQYIRAVSLTSLAVDIMDLERLTRSRNTHLCNLQAWMHNFQFSHLPARPHELSPRLLEKRSPAFLTVTFATSEVYILGDILDSFFGALPLEQLQSFNTLDSFGDKIKKKIQASPHLTWS
ncbi:hypothetical protein BJ165DRAFT_1399522 [Panaeolus papilionaceus]|nr:hypothetical protein BJ165DRAFT_1399522 [Panaeolus papilionaceus]